MIFVICICILLWFRVAQCGSVWLSVVFVTLMDNIWGGRVSFAVFCTVVYAKKSNYIKTDWSLSNKF